MNAITPSSEMQKLRSLTVIVYVLYAAAIFLPVASIIAIIIGYLKRGDSRNTWLESHFTWQIRTFWWCVAFTLIGVATLWIGVGYLILAATLLWYIYRIVKGFIRLYDNRALDAQAWF